MTLDPAAALEALRRGDAAGEPVPPVLPFWGHRPNGRDPVGPWVLSQWWPARFDVGGVAYATAEHWMMAAKARTFGDDAALARVLASDDPAEAKAVGREVRGFESATWAVVAFGHVVAGNRAKFGQHDDLRGYLLSTAGRLLVEASPEDVIWGVGLAAGEADVHRPSRWRGTNLLGFALMAVRDELLATDAGVSPGRPSPR